MIQTVNKRVLLGVTGGIAAYKSAELVRRLREAGAEVQVVMTRGAAEFMTPLTLQALSGRPVRESLWDRTAEAAMGHIDLARWAEIVLVAPASAHFIAKLAHGHADDLLSTLCLATRAPLAVAPAMNHVMWANAATQANVNVLNQRGVRVLGPAAGSQACGEEGMGRMAEPHELVSALAALSRPALLSGLNVLVTAGPTREPLDPVRYITNRSSGKMGYAVAQAAAELGARVTLVSGPTVLSAPPGVARLDVESATQMHEAVLCRVGECDIFVAAAAVADFRPAAVSAQKIKKGSAGLVLDLERTPDILADVAARARAFTVGFAAETEKLEEHARVKLDSKGLDMVAANQVGVAGTGFDADDNALTVLWRGGRAEFPRQPKLALARELVTLIAERFREENPNKDT